MQSAWARDFPPRIGIRRLACWHCKPTCDNIESIQARTYPMAHVSIAEKRRTFRALHEAGCFVIPNPWDIGSARYLQQLGFTALATTSAGFAFSQGLPDSEVAVSRDRSLAHIA